MVNLLPDIDVVNTFVEVTWVCGVRLPVFEEGKIREENKARESVPRQCMYLHILNKLVVYGI